jgi:phosphatidyl-myo-inositol dimannoside synthase
MPGSLRSVLLTPNLAGADGISALSRQILRALPQPAAVLSLHDARSSRLQPAVRRPPEGGRYDIPESVEAHGAGGSRATFLAAASAISLRCSASTEVVCSHLHLSPAAALLAWRGSRMTTMLCGIESWVPLRKSQAWALRRSSLVAISQYTETRFKQANPAFASTDVLVCHPGLPNRPVALMDAACSDGSPALIVARMSADERYKGHDELLELWPTLIGRRPEARLVVAGEGDDRHRLESRARSLGVSHAVTFAGRVNDEELAALYQQCRFLVMPSRDEGFGLVFVEAMRAGKACIGSRGAAAEIIQHDVTGLIVDPASLDELSAAVHRLFDEPATCCRFGAAGRERFLSTFTDVSFQTRFAHAMEPRPHAY